MQPRIVNISTLEGDTLAVYQWPEPPRIKGVVVMSHCFGEYHLRHLVVAHWWFRKGYQVFGFDSYGHNQSSGRSGDLPHLDRNTTDMCTVIDYCKEVSRLHHVPWCLYAVGTSALSAGKIGYNQLRQIDHLILITPALRLTLNPTQTFFAKFAPKMLIKHMRFDADMRGFKLARLGHVASAFDTDPLIVQKISTLYYQSIVQDSAYMRAKAQDWNISTFVVSAGKDTICAHDAIQTFCDAAPPRMITHCHLPDAFHHTQDDPDRDILFNQLSKWLSKLHGDTAPPNTTHSMQLHY